MTTKLAAVLQNVKHAVAPDRIIGPWIAFRAPTDGGPRRAWAPRRTAPALGAARRGADLPGVANCLRHQSRLAQHPVEGAPAATHRGPRRRRLFPDGTWPFTDGGACAAADLGTPLGGRSIRSPRVAGQLAQPDIAV